MAEVVQEGKYQAAIGPVNPVDGGSYVVVKPPIHISERFARHLLGSVNSSQERGQDEPIHTTVIEQMSTPEGTLLTFQADAISGGDCTSQQGMDHFKVVAGALLRAASQIDQFEGVDEF